VVLLIIGRWLPCTPFSFFFPNSTKDHQRLDFEGIHEKVCQLLVPLRTTPAVIGSEDERDRREYTLQMSKRALIDLCKNEASRYLVCNEYELAVRKLRLIFNFYFFTFLEMKGSRSFTGPTVFNRCFWGWGC
jgi:hypothetical protein